MAIVKLILAGFGLGMILGIPGAFLDRKEVLYKVYYTLTVVVLALLLGARLTLKIIELNLHGAASEQFSALLAFFGVLLGGFWVPVVLGFQLIVWVESRFRKHLLDN